MGKLNINEVNEFFGATREIDAGFKETITIHPLTPDALAKLGKGLNLEDTGDQSEYSYRLILESLKDDDLKMDDLKKLAVKPYSKLMNAINDLNGFSDEKDESGTNKIREKIVQIREAGKK